MIAMLGGVANEGVMLDECQQIPLIEKIVEMTEVLIGLMSYMTQVYMPIK